MTTKTIEELQADLAKALDSISRLETKNSELIDREKTEKSRADAAEKKVGDAAKNAAAGDELATLKLEHSALIAERDSLRAERDQIKTDLHSTRVDHAISAAIASGNVDGKHVDAVEAILYRKLDKDADTIGGKSVADFAKSYFAKDGAHYVRAADNSGADAVGNNGAKAVDYSNKPFALGEYQTMLQTNPEQAKAWATATGNGFING
ncbi:hypothetical protein [Sphingobium sp. KCTC 72723]|uniref:hypothetical protein n=1 Tax=Sphingobium sp. KCTC 72723 TaxID=2733867 RepID=UPI00165D9550|nr:hypothetical protein [Sphingobium sp. KCTC 72723]